MAKRNKQKSKKAAQHAKSKTQTKPEEKDNSAAIPTAASSVENNSTQDTSNTVDEGKASSQISTQDQTLLDGKSDETPDAVASAGAEPSKSDEASAVQPEAATGAAGEVTPASASESELNKGEGDEEGKDDTATATEDVTEGGSGGENDGSDAGTANSVQTKKGDDSINANDAGDIGQKDNSAAQLAASSAGADHGSQDQTSHAIEGKASSQISTQDQSLLDGKSDETPDAVASAGAEPPKSDGASEVQPEAATGAAGEDTPAGAPEGELNEGEGDGNGNDNGNAETGAEVSQSDPNLSGGTDQEKAGTVTETNKVNDAEGIEQVNDGTAAMSGASAPKDQSVAKENANEQDFVVKRDVRFIDDYGMHLDNPIIEAAFYAGHSGFFAFHQYIVSSVESEEVDKSDCWIDHLNQKDFELSDVFNSLGNFALKNTIRSGEVLFIQAGLREFHDLPTSSFHSQPLAMRVAYEVFVTTLNYYNDTATAEALRVAEESQEDAPAQKLAREDSTLELVDDPNSVGYN